VASVSLLVTLAMLGGAAGSATGSVPVTARGGRCTVSAQPPRVISSSQSPTGRLVVTVGVASCKAERRRAMIEVALDWFQPNVWPGVTGPSPPYSVTIIRGKPRWFRIGWPCLPGLSDKSRSIAALTLPRHGRPPLKVATRYNVVS
jgi:hypothetical protein